MTNDSFECKLFFGPDVLGDPDETEGALREEFDLMDLSAVDVVLLRGGGVIEFGFGDVLDLLFDGVFDFSEHVFEVREHR